MLLKHDVGLIEEYKNNPLSRNMTFFAWLTHTGKHLSFFDIYSGQDRDIIGLLLWREAISKSLDRLLNNPDE
jgi:hypothetical protein